MTKRNQLVKILQRTTEKLVNEKWLIIDFEELEIGTIFRLREPDGKLVLSPTGASEIVCISKPYELHGIRMVNGITIKD